MRVFAEMIGWLLGSAFAGELLGYLLHRLLHSGWIRWLSASHMTHHMALYGPLQKQRPSESYRDATAGRFSVGNVGIEWLAPSAVLLVGAAVLFWSLQVRIFHQAVFFATVLTWSFVMFSYLHDRMHVLNFWMERSPLLKRWFRHARHLHDIHHHVLNDGGLMDKNFGIGFFLFDRLFGTLCAEPRCFNHAGYAEARKRFSSSVTPRA
jgi:sterol desaturase/sphingolipid hydroxylase (fatty acid hydroxylase superfamily)